MFLLLLSVLLVLWRGGVFLPVVFMVFVFSGREYIQINKESSDEILIDYIL